MENIIALKHSRCKRQMREISHNAAQKSKIKNLKNQLSHVNWNKFIHMDKICGVT
jgi:hypothetical protein